MAGTASRRQRIRIRDFETWIVSKEDLILSKLVWARDSESERQKLDVRNLAATGYDEDYIANWTEELHVNNLWILCRS